MSVKSSWMVNFSRTVRDKSSYIDLTTPGMLTALTGVPWLCIRRASITVNSTSLAFIALSRSLKPSEGSKLIASCKVQGQRGGERGRMGKGLQETYLR